MTKDLTMVLLFHRWKSSLRVLDILSQIIICCCLLLELLYKMQDHTQGCAVVPNSSTALIIFGTQPTASYTYDRITAMLIFSTTWYCVILLNYQYNQICMPHLKIDTQQPLSTKPPIQKSSLSDAQFAAHICRASYSGQNWGWGWGSVLHIENLRDR